MTIEKKYQQACEEFHRRLRDKLEKDLCPTVLMCSLCNVRVFDIEADIEPTGLHNVPRVQTQFKLICKHCGHIMFFDSTKLEDAT